MLSREFSPIFGTRKTTSTGDDVVRIRKVKRKRSVKRTETYDFGKDVLHEPIENVRSTSSNNNSDVHTPCID